MKASLDLDEGEGRALLAAAVAAAEEALEGDPRGTFTPKGEAELRALVEGLDLASGHAPAEVLAPLLRGLSEGQVAVCSHRYFGPFHGAPTVASVAAALLGAAYNPQLAVRRHAPFAVLSERRLVVEVARRFGWAEASCEGTFTTGGAEANTTALLAALTDAFPDHRSRGLRALPGAPTLYVSAEAHGSLTKAARCLGLGTDGVRVVPVDGALAMKVDALEQAVARDRAAGRLPFLVVGTLGSTAGGAIDPLQRLARVAERERLWFHVDAAWGGLLAFGSAPSPLVAPLALADSITFDPHKALAVPLGAGMILVRRRGLLSSAFAVKAPYMPKGASEDPYACSVQWSRRFIGLPLFLNLLVTGWAGYAVAVDGALALGQRLRARLVDGGWKILCASPLPLACFVDGTFEGGASPRYLSAVARDVIESGVAWLCPTILGDGRRALRAVINHWKTDDDDVAALVAALAGARERVRRASS